MPGSAASATWLCGKCPPWRSTTALAQACSRRERAYTWPARGKAREIRHDRLDGGLLQHDLGEPDTIGVGPFAGQRAPGKLAAMAVVPDQEIGAEISAARARRLRRALSPLHPNC